MPKFDSRERTEIESIVADLTIKGIPDKLIMKHIENKTGQTIAERTLRNIRQRIKRESYDWYSQLREGQYEYIYEFKQRINEIRDLQRMHHEIILRNDNDKIYNPSIVQSSLAELHRLNITLSNYFDVAPVIGINSLSTAPETKQSTPEPRKQFIV